MDPDAIDMVADLNGGGDVNVSIGENSASSHGADTRPISDTQNNKTTKIVADTPDNTAKPLSLRDQISSALKSDGDTPAAASQDGKVRNPDGTFAAKPAVDPAAAQAPVAAAPTRAPQGIDPEVFKTLPAETQATLARTMDDLTQRQQRFASLEQLEQVLGPRRQAWALNGMSETQAVNQLLALSDFATRDPKAFTKWFSENNGVNLEELVLTAEPIDPEKKALMDRIAALEGAHAQGTQQQRQAVQKQLTDTVVAFASEKGQDGSPLRPHFDALGTSVLPFITAVKAENPNWNHSQVLQEAYDRACWGTPSVRAKMQAAASVASEADRLRQGAERADKARTAAVGVKPGAPTTAAKPPNDTSRSLRDTIRQSMSAAT